MRVPGCRDEIQTQCSVCVQVRLLEAELSRRKEELSDGLQRVEKVRQQYEKQLELKNSEVSPGLRSRHDLTSCK